MSNNALVSSGVAPSRRALVRGAAWSVPVVAVAATAPAYAASPCDVRAYTLDWGNSALTSYAAPTQSGTGAITGTATALVPAGGEGSSMTATFISTVAGSVTRASDNMALSSETNVGGLGLGRGLNISHADPITAGSSTNNKQTVTMSFNRAVTGLTFWITDIDSNRTNTGSNRNPVYEGWYDRVSLVGGGTFTATKDANILGTGTNADPWYYNDDDTNIGNEAAGARVKIVYSGTIAAGTTIALTYWSTLGGGNQRIFLSDFTWNAKGC
jgi:hypothetical protein